MDKTYDLTKGGIVDKLLLVAVPIMGTMLVQMIYNLTDMFWLGKIGNDAVAASGTAGMYLWLSMAFVTVGRIGAEIGVSQHLGRGDAGSAKAYSQNALLLSALLSLFCALAAIFFSDGLIGVFGIKEQNVAADASGYLRIVGAAFPAAFVAASLSGSFSGSGNSRTPFMANAVGLAANMALDPLFIFTLDMGVAGAAVATSLAQIVVVAIVLAAIKKAPGRPFPAYSFKIKPDRGIITQILRWSLPVALESLLFTVLSMIVTRFVTGFGSDALATQRVGSQVESLSWLLGGGFGSALTAFVGQNFGAGKWTRVHRAFKLSLVIMTVWSVIVTLLLFFGGRALFAIFLSGGEILGMGDTYLKILALCQIFMCFEYVAGGVFRGIGQTVPPSVCSILFNFLRVPLSYALSLTAWGLNGIWAGVSIGAAFRGLVILVWYLISSRNSPKEDITA